MRHLEHLNNAYSGSEVRVGGTNPFLLHPDELKYRQYGALVLDELEEGELVHAGTPMYVDVKAHTARFMRAWTVLSVDGDAVTVDAGWLAPKAKVGMALMVCPSEIGGTGAAAAVTAVEEADGGVKLTVAGIGAAEGDILVEADAEGDAASVKAPANSILTRDLYAAGGQNFVDIPRGELYAYVNTINPIPQAALDNLGALGLVVEWERFPEGDE